VPGLLQYSLLIFLKKDYKNFKITVRDCNGNPSDKKIEVESLTDGNGKILYLSRCESKLIKSGL
jgi:hypothetical protein